jgi:hypothetical protein|tara:strand:- start:305 stop:430 length:126 start_codon:yes stop_codon:yes gene_type:complete
MDNNKFERFMYIKELESELKTLINKFIQKKEDELFDNVGVN